MVERDACIMLIMTQLEGALENETLASVALVQARATLVETIRTFRGLAVQVRPALEALGLETPLISSEPYGSIAL
jgi:alpha-D-ribose 1-methylphosphonate 5-triphosphate synthase subunit PhnI